MSVEPVKPFGISMQGFYEFLAAHGGRGALTGFTTEDVKQRIILPATGHTRSSYAEQLLALGSPHVAPATAFISHAYDDQFLGMLDSVAALEAREGTSGFYFFDLLVLKQHGQSAVVPFEVLRDEFVRSVKAIGRTLLVLRWADPIPLKRAWCVYEMATSLAVEAGIKVLMPPEDAAEFTHALTNYFDSLVYQTCRVDVEKASAREEADLLNIHRVIRESSGFLKINQEVISAMQQWMVDEGRAALAAAGGETEKVCLMMCLGSLLIDQGKLREAEPLYRQALSTRRGTVGDTHPDTLISINNLAVLLRARGNMDEAEQLFLEALTARRRVLKNDDPSLLASVNNMANLLKSKKDLIGAEALFLEALAVRKHSLGEEHRDTLASMNNLANLLKEQGKVVEAEELYTQALAARRRVLGSDHPDTLKTINNLATLLYSQHKPEAEALMKEVVTSYRRTLGNKHPYTLASISNLALLKARDNLGEAQALFIEVLDGRRSTLGNDHSDTLSSIKYLAKVLQARGNDSKAQKLFSELAAAEKCVACKSDAIILTSATDQPLQELVSPDQLAIIS
jgi:tetratricopeptide (TPR) repeat protein